MIAAVTIVTVGMNQIATETMTETQAQLINSIEQQLENLMSLDDDLAYQYECDFYYDCGDDEEPKPIVELFTPELLKEIEDFVYQLDNEPIEIDD